MDGVFGLNVGLGTDHGAERAVTLAELALLPCLLGGWPLVLLWRRPSKRCMDSRLVSVVTSIVDGAFVVV